MHPPPCLAERSASRALARKRVVEASRGCVPCHADLGSFHRQTFPLAGPSASARQNGSPDREVWESNKRRKSPFQGAAQRAISKKSVSSAFISGKLIANCQLLVAHLQSCPHP